jgi:hypothetical protein
VHINKLDEMGGLLIVFGCMGVIQFINSVNINFKVLCILAKFDTISHGLRLAVCDPDLLTLYHKLNK